MPPVARGAAPSEVEDEAPDPLLPLVAAATWIPYWVLVVVTVVPLAVMVLVATEVAVVEAVQPPQLVQGASVAQAPLVQPDQVEGGQASVPHQLVQSPVVHAPEEAHGPHP